MNAIPQLLKLARLYGEAQGVEPHTVSWRAFRDSKRIRALEAGKTLTIRRAEASLRWFSDNWPPNLQWPSDVPRPGETEAAA